MKYADGSWQVDSVEATEGEPYHYAIADFVPYVRWAFSKGLAGEIHRSDEDNNADLQKAINGEKSWTEFVEQWMDCQFNADDLNDEGQSFTNWYYEIAYTDDIEEQIEKGMFTKVAEDWDMDKISAILDNRYQEFLIRAPQGLLPKGYDKEKKPWWKFW